jgi:hypothetical protein
MTISRAFQQLDNVRNTLHISAVGSEPLDFTFETSICKSSNVYICLGYDLQNVSCDGSQWLLKNYLKYICIHATVLASQ